MKKIFGQSKNANAQFCFEQANQNPKYQFAREKNETKERN
jgi:hypothetical protein